MVSGGEEAKADMLEQVKDWAVKFISSGWN